MAEGDITFFEDSMEKAWEDWAGTDTLFCAVLKSTSLTPAGTQLAPELADYTEVGTGGTYVAGGTSLGTLANFINFSAKVTTLDSTVNPSWALDAGNDTDARWLMVYNTTQALDPCLCFVDLGGNKNMTTGTLGATWDATGLATLTLP